MRFERSKEWWLARIGQEPDLPCTVGAPDGAPPAETTRALALRECQRLANDGIGQFGEDSEAGALFVHIHRVAVTAMQSREPPRNEASK